MKWTRSMEKKIETTNQTAPRKQKHPMPAKTIVFHNNNGFYNFFFCRFIQNVLALVFLVRCAAVQCTHCTIQSAFFVCHLQNVVRFHLQLRTLIASIRWPRKWETHKQLTVKAIAFSCRVNNLGHLASLACILYAWLFIPRIANVLLSVI